MNHTYSVMTAIGTLEVHFVDADRACVWTPNGATVTVGKGIYTANVHYTRTDGTWAQDTVGQSAPLLKRQFPDLRPVPPTIESKILDQAGIALRAILEDDPGAPDRAEIAYAEAAVQDADAAAKKAHADAHAAEEKLAKAWNRLRAAIRDCGVSSATQPKASARIATTIEGGQQVGVLLDAAGVDPKRYELCVISGDSGVQQLGIMFPDAADDQIATQAKEILHDAGWLTAPSGHPAFGSAITLHPPVAFESDASDLGPTTPSKP